MSTKLVLLLGHIADRRFWISPLLQGDEGGELYQIGPRQLFAGFMTLRRVRGGLERHILDVDVDSFGQIKDADNSQGILNLRTRLSVGGHGICYRGR